MTKNKVATVKMNLSTPLYKDQNATSMRWLTKVSQMLVDDDWPCEETIAFDGSWFQTNSVEDVLRVFLSSVKCNGKVRSLRLKNTSLDLKSQKLLLDALLSNQEIHRLELWNVSTDNPCGCLNSSFFSHSNVEDLTLVKCKVEKETASAIGDKIRSGTLKKLKLINLAIEKESFALVESIAEGSLRNLEFRDIRVDNITLSRIIRGLAFNEELESLHLHHCGIGVTFVEGLSSLLAKNQSLKTLSLKRNELDGASIGIIKDRGLLHNHTLKSLNLSYNPIGDDGARHMKDLLASNTTIESLSMVECDVWNPGCVAFIQGLPKMKGLKQLVVDSEWENHAGILLPAIQVNMYLCQLWTSHSGILMKIDPQWKEIGFYLRLNHAKRRMLVEPSVPLSAWPHVLAQSTHDANVLYHFLTHKPDLIPITQHSCTTKGTSPLE